MFFQQLSELSKDLDITLRVSIKGGICTVSAMPANFKATQPVIVSGTIAEMDEGFIESIKAPVTEGAGLKSNADQVMEEIKAAPATTAKPEEKKTPAPDPAKSKPVTKTKPAAQTERTAPERRAAEVLGQRGKELTEIGFDNDEGAKQFFINQYGVSRELTYEKIGDLRNPDWFELIKTIKAELATAKETAVEENKETHAVPPAPAAQVTPTPTPPRPAPPVLPPTLPGM